MKAFVTSAALGQAMLDEARDGLNYARAIAPVGETGGYQDSLYAEQVMVEAGYSNERRAGAMIATDIAYNSVVENAHRVLSRTADYMRGGR